MKMKMKMKSPAQNTFDILVSFNNKQLTIYWGARQIKFTCHGLNDIEKHILLNFY